MTLQLAVSAGLRYCSELQDLVVEETSEEVNITATSVLESTGDCPAAAAIETRRVELEKPLGNRALVGCRPRDADDDSRTENMQRLDPAITRPEGMRTAVESFHTRSALDG